MIDSQEVKRMARELGADLVGIASAQRFDMAPEGFRPADVLLGAQNGITVNQKKCREGSQSVTKKGYFLYTCNLCRKICPSRTGIK